MSENRIGGARSGSRRKVKKSGCVIGIIVLLLFALAGGGTLYYMSAFNPIQLAEEVTVTVPQGAGSKQIAALLDDSGVIKSKTVFGFYVKQQKAAANLRPGTYTFGPGEVDMEAVVAKLQKGGLSENTMNITIPEGLTVEQTADLLAQKGVVDKQKFLDYAADLDIPYDYIPKGKDYNQLEGFLFPETYNILKTWGEKEIIDMMLAQFDKVFTQEWRDRAKEMNMSIYDVVKLASIIEREALYDSDRPIISGVFHNRLDISMRLQSCATVQYILGEPKAVLTNADVRIESPYNTYLHEGLPPTPIASPGAKSLEAALYPEKTDYLYFLAKPDGHHYFSKTLDEHNAAKKKYLQ